MFTIRLIIFEKPSQARTVCKIFKTTDRKSYLEIAPNEYMPKGGIAVWCVGHVLRLAEPSKYNASYKEWKLELLPIIPENLILEVDPSKYKIYKNIVTRIQKPEIKTIIHAGDPAREDILTYVNEYLYKSVYLFYLINLIILTCCNRQVVLNSFC